MPAHLPFSRAEWVAMTVDQRWHYRNRERNTERTLTRRAHIRDWLNDQKAERGCSQCGADTPACLDFHHRKNEKKAGTVCELMTRGWSRDRLRGELEKCVVLCANCHREEHTAGSVSGDDARARKRQFVAAYKAEQGCARCQVAVSPAALACHHRDDAAKDTAVGRLISDGCSMDALRAELANCDVLCANCHRKEHFTDPLASGSGDG